MTVKCAKSYTSAYERTITMGGFCKNKEVVIGDAIVAFDAIMQHPQKLWYSLQCFCHYLIIHNGAAQN